MRKNCYINALLFRFLICTSLLYEGKYLDRSAAAMLATVSDLAAKLDTSMTSLIARIGELEGRMSRIEQAVTTNQMTTTQTTVI